MNVFEILAIIGYTITVFSIRYTLGKDISRKQK